MNIQKIAISAGAALALLLPIAPEAMAQSAEGRGAEELAQEQLLSQRRPRQQVVVSGKIVEIVGDVVAVKLSDGKSGNVSLCWQERGALGIVVGMRISATLEGRSIVALSREVITSQRIASSSLLQRVREVRRQLQRTQRTPQRRFTTPPRQRIPQVPQRARPQVPSRTVPQAPARPVRALW